VKTPPFGKRQCFKMDEKGNFLWPFGVVPPKLMAAAIKRSKQQKFASLPEALM
jgi:hypothetical protein